MAQGDLITIGRHDILATATGKPEHLGHVRGVGHGVGIKDYFRGSSRYGPGMITKEEVYMVVDSIKE